MRHINTWKRIHLKIFKNPKELKTELEKLKKEVARQPDLSGKTEEKHTKTLRYYFSICEIHKS